MKVVLIIICLTSVFLSANAVVCPRAERLLNRPTGCHSSVFYECKRTFGVRRVCDHQLNQPSTWRRGMSVFESCQRNQPPERYSAIATFLGPTNYPYYGPIRNSALFLNCGPSNSIIIMDQQNNNRSYPVWQTNVLNDRGPEISEYNSRLYYVIEKSFSRYN